MIFRDLSRPPRGSSQPGRVAKRTRMRNLVLTKMGKLTKGIGIQTEMDKIRISLDSGLNVLSKDKIHQDPSTNSLVVDSLDLSVSF